MKKVDSEVIGGKWKEVGGREEQGGKRMEVGGGKERVEEYR